MAKILMFARPLRISSWHAPAQLFTIFNFQITAISWRSINFNSSEMFPLVWLALGGKCLRNLARMLINNFAARRDLVWRGIVAGKCFWLSILFRSLKLSAFFSGRFSAVELAKSVRCLVSQPPRLASTSIFERLNILSAELLGWQSRREPDVRFNELRRECLLISWHYLIQ